MDTSPLLGCFPIEMVLADEVRGNSWEIATFSGYDDPEQCADHMRQLLTADVQWRAFKLAKHEAPPIGAMAIDPEESLPLRFSAAHGEPINPEVMVPDGKCVLSELWLEAPLQAEISFIGAPKIRICIMDKNRVARSFDPGDAKFWVQIKEREKENR